jgi:hypothetical protein
MNVSVRITSKEYTISYRDNTSTVYFLWMAATTATHSARLSVRGWGSVYPGWYYPRCWAYRKPNEVAKCHFQHWFSVNVWCGMWATTWLHRMLSRDVYQLRVENIFWKMNYLCIWGCVSYNRKTNVQATWRSMSSLRQSSNVNFERRLLRKMDRKMWTGDLAHSVSWLNRFGFLSLGLHEVESASRW